MIQIFNNFVVCSNGINLFLLDVLNFSNCLFNSFIAGVELLVMGLEVLLGLGIIILAGRAFDKGLKKAVQLTTIGTGGYMIAQSGNSNDENKRKLEEEKRRLDAVRRQLEEERRRLAEEKLRFEEEKRLLSEGKKRI